MKITYADGRSTEGILLRREGNVIRVAVPASDDVRQFVQMSGGWVSEDCDPVQIEFHGQRHAETWDAVSEENFICSHQLAARLLHLLWNDSEEDLLFPGQVPSAAGPDGVVVPRLMLN